MKTEKLYYEDGKQLSFRARVLECREAEDGWDIVLDRTAFYPGAAASPATWASWRGETCWMSRKRRT